MPSRRCTNAARISSLSGPIRTPSRRDGRCGPRSRRRRRYGRSAMTAEAIARVLGGSRVGTGWMVSCPAMTTVGPACRSATPTTARCWFGATPAASSRRSSRRCVAEVSGTTTACTVRALCDGHAGPPPGRVSKMPTAHGWPSTCGARPDRRQAPRSKPTCDQGASPWRHRPPCASMPGYDIRRAAPGRPWSRS